MDEKRETAEDSTYLDWKKMIDEYSMPFYQQWHDYFQQLWNQEQWKIKGRVAESLYSSAKMWQTIAGAMISPEALDRAQKAGQMTPDIVFGFTQTCLQGLHDLQVQINEWIQKRGASLTAADVQELDRELLKTWTETYEKEFRRYLKIPQVGLTRLHQERVLDAADKLNVFQMELLVFLQMLYMPVEKSLNSLQVEMTEMAEHGTIDEKSKTYYNLWIKLLEGHYMELFKQAEYVEVLHKTLFALHEFSEAKNNVVSDALKQMNIPSYHDIDELSKEIYLLKKRIRALEQK